MKMTLNEIIAKHIIDCHVEIRMNEDELVYSRNTEEYKEFRIRELKDRMGRFIAESDAVKIEEKTNPSFLEGGITISGESFVIKIDHLKNFINDILAHGRNLQ